MNFRNNTLIDNTSISMQDVLIEHLQDSSFQEICIATGYWDLPAMELLYDSLIVFLKRPNTKLKILIGREPEVRSYQMKTPFKRIDFPREFIKKDIHELEIKEPFEKVVELLLDYCSKDSESNKIEIRVYGQNANQPERFLHAKCYIFKSENSHGIIGSANFTQKGLAGNTELCYLETGSAIVSAQQNENSQQYGHIYWFNEKWEQSMPWNQVFLCEILQPSPLGDVVCKKREIINQPHLITPYECYIKFLQEFFGKIIDSHTDDIYPMDPSFKKLEYQLHAVNNVLEFMYRHNGCILADVVGLGKTIIAVMVIKRFLNREGFSQRVLIVVPPAIEQVWLDTLDYFDKGHELKIGPYIDVVSLGSVEKLVNDIDEGEGDDDNACKEIDSMRAYGCIVVDESHRFRNNNTAMYRSLKALTQAQRPKVLLLSATPLNNRPDDLRNQIYLFQHEPNNTTLDTILDRKLDTYFNTVCKTYARLISSSDENKNSKTEERKKEDLQAIKVLFTELRERVVDPLVVRRTRTDLIKHYGKDIAAQNIKFPEIKDPQSIEYKLNKQLATLFFETLNLITSELSDVRGEGLGYYRYRATESLKPEFHQFYEKNNLTVLGTSDRLANLMQTLLVKRLESSFDAFKQSLNNLKNNYENMVQMFEDDRVFICPDIDIKKELNVENDRFKAYENIQQKMTKKSESNREFKSHDFNPEFISNLRKDLILIEKLCSWWEKVNDDPKKDQFVSYLRPMLMTGNPSKKLIIFTEAIDTAKALEERLKTFDEWNVLCVTAQNRAELRETIQANFDANYPQEKQCNDYDILITTDVLAEGVNLHRANVILNYDTPWNATKLMQRIGRVNRIGSQAEFIYVYNFLPSAEGDAQIELVKKALTKLQSFHTLLGEDSKIFSDKEVVTSHDLKITLYDEPESPTTRFIAELKIFKEQYPEQYERILRLQRGCYSVCNMDKKQMVFYIKANEYDKALYLANEESMHAIPISEMAEHLLHQSKCASAPPLPEDSETKKEAVLQLFLDHRINVGLRTSKDQNTIINSALSIIVPILRAEKLPEIALRQLRIARDMVHSKNVRLAQNICEVFGKEDLLADNKQDFLIDLIQTHLGSLQERNKQTGKLNPYIALSAIMK